jgi:hypothetical protein
MLEDGGEEMKHVDWYRVAQFLRWLKSYADPKTWKAIDSMLAALEKPER